MSKFHTIWNEERFINFDELVTEEVVEEIPTLEGPQLNPNLYRRVEELELSVRSANCLANANIQYIEC